MVNTLVNTLDQSRSRTNARETVYMQLGQILLRKRLIAPHQLEEAIRQQHFFKLKLGELLIQKGWLAPEQLQEALQEQNWRKQGFWII